MEALKNKRKNMKRSLTNFLKYVNEENTSGDVSQLKVRLEKIEELWDAFEAVQTEIEELETSETDTHIEYRENFEENYYKAVGKARQIIDNFEQKTERLTNQSAGSNSNNTANTVMTGVYDRVYSKLHLPTLNLPKFNGEYTNWLLFKDSFSSTIHNNATLTNVEKFRYLKSVLQDGALQLLSSIETTNDNYVIAWELLNNRYENKKIIVHTHMKALFEMPQLFKETHVNLRQTIDNFQMHVRALKALEEPVEHWDTILIYLLAGKLDGKTRRDWETHVGDDKSLTFKDLVDFLSNRCQILEMSDKVNRVDSSKRNISLATGTTKFCVMCKNSNHAIYTCRQFLELSIQDRITQIKQLKLCFNCLRSNHQVYACKAGKCSICKNKHNTLLHRVDTTEQRNDSDIQKNKIPEDVSQEIGMASTCLSTKVQTILPTVMLQVWDESKQQYYTVKALLDTGSQSNFITTDLCHKLNLKTNKSSLSISGLNQTLTKTTMKCQIRIQSIKGHFKKSIPCLVVDHITDVMSLSATNIAHLQIPDCLELADVSFHNGGAIDILLGTTIFFETLCKNQISLGKDKPMLQETLFGWIVAGSMQLQKCTKVTSLLCHEQNLQDQLRMFWETEEPSVEKIKYSNEEEECLRYFNETTTRDERGQFIVKMPLKDNIEQLGDTYDIALGKFCSLEKRFQVNPDLHKQYLKFMKEYEELGHMTKIIHHYNDKAYYLPHHPVVKNDSLTTKLRVVFDGSAKPSNELSLNETQKVGPTLQNDLFSIIVRFRRHSIALTADVEKMYRKVWIHESQRHLQQIIWRENQEQPISIYQLNTVTYGEAAAPFLAIRSLIQTAVNNEERNPLACDVIKNDFYVDDLLSGAENENHAYELYSGVSNILASANFSLRKWNSNDSNLLQKISKTRNEQEDRVYVCSDAKAKTLGIHWNPREDIFQFKVNVECKGLITKRIALSYISQIFDPLGLVSPVTILAKIFIQKLWENKIDWDQSLPNNLYSEWHNVIRSIHAVNSVRIPRYLACTNKSSNELHCFSDASEKAYAACIYLKTTQENGICNVNLICSKTKVAPLKSISIPRLELCASLLLTRLVVKTISALKLNICRTIYWTDSTIVLSWIRTSPHLLKTFVANRITEIQNTSTPENWRHVPSKDNPADIASRGIYSNTLEHCELWWHGPSWLLQEEINWPLTNHIQQNVLEMKEVQTCHMIETTPDIFTRFSTFTKLVRITTYILRFKVNCLPSNHQKTVGPLTVAELDRTLNLLIRLSQQESFFDEITQLTKKHQLSRKSKLIALNPYIDENGLMRVYGRLQNSQFNENKKCPLILNAKHNLTKLIFKEAHLKLMHGGPQLLLSHVRENYWPIGGRNLAKQVVRSCVTCFKVNPKPLEALMGNLPSTRLEAKYPFYATGIDYAGPFLLKEGKRRKSQTTKAYISLFICLTTRAIHLEIVSDLTTETFVMSLRRFISRRGKPAHIYSDNGTNFVGTNNRLRELGNFLKSYNTDVIEYSTNQNITWHFIPSHSPHFGGMWEAGVKSVKHHLRRTMGNAALTFEEFSTIITQIEAILNSRPITPLTHDTNDLYPLTPGHFLIGRPLTSIPDPNMQTTPENRLRNYQRIQQITQHFWSRWSKEYISELQQRQKWKQTQQNITIGTVVLIKDEKLPPLSWTLGRVEEVHPGVDGVIRVVSLRIASGNIIRRSIVKICPLPTDGVGEVECN